MKSKTIMLGLTLSSMGAMAFGPALTIDWHTIDGGGAMSSTGGGFEVAGTIGQADAASSPVLAGGTLTLTGGFWAVSQVCFCLGDLNHDGVKDGGDIQKFVGCLLAGGDCSCADVDGASGVTVDDTAVFVDDLLAGSSCS